MDQPGPELDRRGVLLGGIGAGIGLAASGCARHASETGPQARTRQGSVIGFTRNRACLFLGIPYGASTAGPNRFMPPRAPAAWRGLRDATRFGQRAPQAEAPLWQHPVIGAYMAGGRQAELAAMPEPMGEDCLVLNVITPAADHAARPVLVYIHGGGFETGSGAIMTLGERAVIEHDFVHVTVNHRLNAFGFAWLGEVSPGFAPGNVGMLDLVAALEWVRNNIAAFGGDPARVTICGESGGGAKVALLMAMPQARGLFRAAIIESGMPPRPTPAAHPAQAVRAFMATHALADVAALQRLPMRAVLDLPSFGPVADGTVIPPEPWATAPASAAEVPLLIGYCAKEASLFTAPEPATIGWEHLPAALAAANRIDAARAAPVVAAYRALYPDDDPRGIFLRLQTLAGDFGGVFTLAAKKAAQPAPVYLYRVEYDPGLGNLGAFHTCELPLSMRMVLQPRADALSRRISSAWANFVHHGDPAGPGLPPWPRHAPDRPALLRFDRAPLPPGPDPETTARQLWASALRDLAASASSPARPGAFFKRSGTRSDSEKRGNPGI